MMRLNSKFVDRGSTLLLKLVVLFLSIGTLALCGVLSYLLLTAELIGGYGPVFVGVVVSSIPFFYIYYQSYLLLNNIDRNQSLSNSSVLALRKIKLSSFVISALYLLGSPYVYIVGDRDDAPGVVLINLILIVVPFVVGVFAAILQKLLINAIAYKSENELTI